MHSFRLVDGVGLGGLFLFCPGIVFKTLLNLNVAYVNYI